MEKRNPQRIGSGVVVNGALYIANAGPGIVQCIDIETGEEKWRSGRLSGGNAWGSVVHAAGRCYVTCQNGTTHVFRPNPEKYEELATNPLPTNSNATPAFSDGEIFIRTTETLYCIASSAE